MQEGLILRVNHCSLMMIIIAISMMMKIIAQEIAECTFEDINSHIGKCNRNGSTRDIVYYFMTQCDRFSEKAVRLPQPQLTIACKICPPGSIISESANSQCFLCPKNTYSTGNSMRFNGEYMEFNQKVFAFELNNCYLLSTETKEVNKNCLGWSIGEEAAYIKTNHYFPDTSTNNSNDNFKTHGYLASFAMSVSLINKGVLKVKYEKENVYINGIILSGRFMVYVDHVKVYEDNTFNAKEIIISIDLSAGDHMILFEYYKKVVKEEEKNKELSMKINHIEIEGIDNRDTKCIPCEFGYSKEGSDHCLFCSKGEYYNKVTQKCIQCPSNTTTYSRNPTDPSECISINECNDDSYEKSIVSLCHNETNKHLVIYKLQDNKCYETKKSRKKTIDCLECLIGQFRFFIDNEYFKCTDCPKGTYSISPNAPLCSLCQNGVISKLSYYYPLQTNEYIINTEIESNGLMTIDYKVISSMIPKISVTIDSNLSPLIYPEKEIKLSKGKHTITIQSDIDIDIYIDRITITNTVNGLGYQCTYPHQVIKANEDCPSGSEYNSSISKCVKCKGNKYKSTIDKKCLECPLFTYPSKNHSKCIISGAISYKPDKLLFDFSSLKKILMSSCLSNHHLCHGNRYYGPIITPLEDWSYFFLSINYTFLFNDSSPLLNIDKSNTKSIKSQFPINHSSLTSGFIYRTNKLSNFTYESITNIGSDLDYVKIVNGQNEKGIIIKYSNGDICDKTTLARYESFIFIRCQNEQYLNNQIRLISKTDCGYYFEFSSKIGCPVCNKKQITQVKIDCKWKTKTFNTIKAEKDCVFTNLSGKYKSKEINNKHDSKTDDQKIFFVESDEGKMFFIESKDIKALLDKTIDKKVIKIYSIEQLNQPIIKDYKNNNEDESNEDDIIYVDNSQEIELKCFDKPFYIFVFLVAFGVYGIIIIIMSLVYCKYIHKQKIYVPLTEIPNNINKLNTKNEFNFDDPQIVNPQETQDQQDTNTVSENATPHIEVLNNE